MSVVFVAALALTASQVSPEVFENPAPFEVMNARDGLELSGRAIVASPYREYRVTTVTPLPVTDLCDAVFEWGTRGGDGPGMILNTVLLDGEARRVVYSQISQALVAKRDYVLAVEKQRGSSTTCRVRFRTTSELSPPKPDGFVRMTQLWGEWRFEALGDGRSSLTYTTFSDPAGSVPSFLVHGGQQRATRDSVLQALAKTRQWASKKK